MDHVVAGGPERTAHQPINIDLTGRDVQEIGRSSPSRPERIGAPARSRPFETVFTGADEDEDDQNAEHFDCARILRKIVRMLAKS